MPVKTLYHTEADQESSHNGRNSHILGANVLGNEPNHPNDGSAPLYDAHFPHHLLPELSHGGMQQDPLRQWTPIPTGNIRPSFYLDQDTGGGQAYSRLPSSSGTLDAYPQQNVFSTLTNMSDNGPSSIQAYSRGKQPDRIALPSLQGYQRSPSLDLGARSTPSTLGDVAAPYHGYKGYSLAAESSTSAPIAPIFTFSPLKTPQLGSTYSRRGSPPAGQPPLTIGTQSAGTIGRSYPAGFSSISTAYSHSYMFPPLPPTSTTLECESKRENNCEIPKGGSSDSTGSSVPASPYSSSPTSSLYGTTRSQPHTPVSMFPSDKGLNTHSSHRRQLNKIY